MTGRFITLEGGEGVGKSTQLKALADAIEARGHSVVTTREPGGSEGAEAIRALLMQGGEEKWSARAEALLFAAARADHVEKLIRPALTHGNWVLCDRFIDSSRAYQGGAGGLSDDDVMTLHRIGSEGMLPDRALILTLPDNEAGSRAATRDGGNIDRFGAKNRAYHQRVAQAFATFAEVEPERIFVIDALGGATEVTARLIAAIEDLL
jgi:dTMP kinase